MKQRWQKLTALISLGMIYFSPVRAETWESLTQTIRKKFPAVPQMSTGQLASWLAATNKPAPLLIDARAAGEFAVSHLKDARNLDTVAGVKALAASNTQPIVVYCSVGYRSSALAE